jgi:hypothetical protein
LSHTLFGGAAVACLVIGCGWTVYSNIINANAYPTIGNADHVEAVVRRPMVAERSTVQVIHETFAALPAQPAVVAAITQDMFNERFSAAHADGVASNASAVSADAPKLAEARETPRPVEAPRLAEAPRLTEAPRTKEAAPAQLALNVPPPVVPAPPRAAETKPSKLRDMAQRAKNAVMSIASNEKQSMVEKLWGKESSHSLLAYASADASSITGSVGREQNPMMGGAPPYDRETAVYDITAHTVYLPDGSKLEAHSGLGDNMDDPRSQKIRMRGVTPPHIYTLKPRESLFHGVAALRLTPIGGEESIFGRDGLLAHTFMLGSSGASNGCVSFRDYNAFLNAYRNQGIRKLAVVARVE